VDNTKSSFKLERSEAQQNFVLVLFYSNSEKLIKALCSVLMLQYAIFYCAQLRYAQV